jgi:hypothetical protein
LLHSILVGLRVLLPLDLFHAVKLFLLLLKFFFRDEVLLVVSVEDQVLLVLGSLSPGFVACLIDEEWVPVHLVRYWLLLICLKCSNVWLQTTCFRLLIKVRVVVVVVGEPAWVYLRHSFLKFVVNRHLSVPQVLLLTDESIGTGSNQLAINGIDTADSYKNVVWLSVSRKLPCVTKIVL